MSSTPDTTDWPYDADRDDPLTALRIPVTSAYPGWRYTACFDRESEARPTDLEAQQLASFIEEYREYWFNAWYKAKLSERPFDTDAVTRIFHKWAEDDWSYRMVTWEYGPFWVPVAPRLRGGEYDHKPWPGPMPLVQVMDRIHTIVDEPMAHWLAWKAQHPDVFGEYDAEADFAATGSVFCEDCWSRVRPETLASLPPHRCAEKQRARAEVSGVE